MLILKSRRRGGDLLVFGPDSRALAARSETGLQSWSDVTSGTKAQVFRELHEVGHMQFFPDGESRNAMSVMGFRLRELRKGRRQKLGDVGVLTPSGACPSSRCRR